MMYNHSRLLHLKSAKANMVHRKDIRNYLDELCEAKGVVGEPVIFQTKEDRDKKKASILGDGSGEIEKGLYWILGDSS